MSDKLPFGIVSNSPPLDVNNLWQGFLPVLNNYLLVGAKQGHQEFNLSDNDSILMRDVINTIGTTWQILEALPKNYESLKTQIADYAHPDPQLRQDFLKMDFDQSEKITVFCNIPGEQTYYCDQNIEPHAHNISILKSAFERDATLNVSDNHNDLPLWVSQIEKSNSLMVFIFGVDSFEARKLKGSLYIEVPRALFKGSDKQILIRKDYLEKLHSALSFLKENETEPKFYRWADSVVMDGLDALPKKNNKKQEPA